MYKKSLEKLGYYQILENLKLHALTQEAKNKIQELEPFLSETALRKNLNETTQAKNLLECVGFPPLPNMDGIGEHINKAIRAELLLPEHFEQIGLFLNAVQRLKSYLTKGQERQVSIAFYNENLIMPESLKSEIDRCIRNNAIDDYASVYLKDIRRQLKAAEEKMSAKAEQGLRTYSSYSSDSFVVNRNGHLCIPIKKEYRSKVNGTIIEKSSSGFTLFIETQAVADLREDVEFYRIEEDSEERRILFTLLNLVADNEAVLTEDIRTIVLLDFIFAKGKLSLAMDGIEPRINLEHFIDLSGARHPMISKEQCVPLDFKIGNGIKGVIITGPNTGGKTVTLKTVALLTAMANSGLHIPCQSADITMNAQILCDIGDGQNISDNLSTFSAHIQNVLEILKRVNSETLVVMDELGSGTDPAEGMGIAIAILEELRKSGALFLVTTHYPEVKDFAARYPEIINARMEFDKQSLKPLYKLCLGESGESCALYIARCLGVPDEMLKTAAKEAYGTTDHHKNSGNKLVKIRVPHIQRCSTPKPMPCATNTFARGDSVTLPDDQIGIIVTPADKLGNVLVQVKKEKQVINHKRLKLKVPASQLYPEDYDFSIIFDTVDNRKARHKMEKGHQEGLSIDLDLTKDN